MSEEVEVPVEETKVEQTPAEPAVVKEVAELGPDEIIGLVENARQGIEDPNYKVTLYKNGNYRITKKKVEKPKVPKVTTAEKQIKSKSQMMSNDQLLMEHVIDLTAKVEKMRSKAKKLKAKYKKMKNDIYSYEDADDNVREVKPEELVQETPAPKEEKSEEPEVPRQIPQQRMAPGRVGWRALVRV